MSNTKEEFLSLIDDNRNIIYKVCFVYSDCVNTHEDLFQEVVINLWSSWPRFRGDCKVQTWIYRIALNTCVSFLRKSKARPSSLPLTNNIKLLRMILIMKKSGSSTSILTTLRKLRRLLFFSTWRRNHTMRYLKYWGYQNQMLPLSFSE